MVQSSGSEPEAAPGASGPGSILHAGPKHASGARILHGKMVVLGLHGGRRLPAAALPARPPLQRPLLRRQQGRRFLRPGGLRPGAVPGLRRLARLQVSPAASRSTARAVPCAVASSASAATGSPISRTAALVTALIV